MAELRAAGVCVTAAHVVRDTQAWSVAVHHHRKLMGSLSLVFREGAQPDHINQCINLLKRAVLRIEGRLTPSTQDG